MAGKGFARIRSDEEGGVVVLCSFEEKQQLLTSGHQSFLTLPHYNGYGAVIVGLDLVEWDQLIDLLSRARLAKAPKRLR